MSQTERRLKPSFENSAAFLENSTAPITRRVFYPPVRPPQSLDTWVRNWEMVGRYIGTEATLDQIAKPYGLTRERVRQIVKRGVHKLHQLSDPSIQQAYPFESLGFSKPLSLELRKRMSLLRTGISVEVAELAGKGNSATEIRAKLRGSGDVDRAIATARNWGVKIEYTRRAFSPEYQRRLKRLREERLSDEEVQKILDSFTSSTLYRFSRGDKPLFMPVLGLAKEAGLFRSARGVADAVGVLREKGVPVAERVRTLKNRPGGRQTILRNYFIFAGHKNRAIQQLTSQDSSL